MNGIDYIVEMVLKAARARRGTELVSNIHLVMSEVEHMLILVIDNVRQEERRKEKDENKDRKKPGSNTG